MHRDKERVARVGEGERERERAVDWAGTGMKGGGMLNVDGQPTTGPHARPDQHSFGAVQTDVRINKWRNVFQTELDASITR